MAPVAAPPSAAEDVQGFPAADLERRLSAAAIDRLLAWGVAAGVAVAGRRLAETSVGLAVLLFVVALLLVGLVVAVLLGTTGMTPAKALLGLRVVRQSDGMPIGVVAATGRIAALGLAGLPTLGLGAATLGWTAAVDPGRRRRGLHDRIGDAVVVDVRVRPTHAKVPDEQPQQLVNLTAMRLLPSPSPAQPAQPVQPAQPPQVAAAPALPAPPAPGSHRAAPSASGAATRLRDQPGVPARWEVAFDTGETFEVLGLAIVGRRPEPRAGEPVRHVLALPSTDMSLSKTHAQFQVAPDGALVVMDRGSTNGSYVVRGGHSRALTAGRPSTLLDGDVVRFGDRSMTVTRL